MTLEILKKAMKIQKVFTFKHDTDIEKKPKIAQSYNNLLRDFPINQLLSATTLEQITAAIEAIFL